MEKDLILHILMLFPVLLPKDGGLRQERSEGIICCTLIGTRLLLYRSSCHWLMDIFNAKSRPVIGLTADDIREANLNSKRARIQLVNWPTSYCFRKKNCCHRYRAETFIIIPLGRYI